MASQTKRTVHTEEVKITNEKIADPLPNAPLVTFDLNLNNLQDYLNRISTLINTHTFHIQNLTEEIESKISLPEGFEILESIALSIPKEMGGRNPRNNDLKDGISAASSGIQGICDRIIDFDDFQKSTQKKLRELENSISLKLSSEKFDIEKEYLEEKIQEKINRDAFVKKISLVEAMIKNTEDKINDINIDLGKRISDLEVNTQWKIRDCENLLKTRVNDKYVWDAINTIEQKMRKEFEITNADKIKKQKSFYDKLEKELKRLEGEIIAKSYEARNAVESIEKVLQHKVNEDQYNFLINLINSKDKDLNSTSLCDLEKKIKELDDKIDSLTSVIPKSPVEELKNLTSKIENLEIQLEKKAEREPVIELFNNLKNIKPQYSQSQIQYQEITDLLKFKEKAIQNFEKIDEKFDKLEKINKASDLSKIKRILSTKANEEQTKEEFYLISQRVSDLERNQNEILKELERLNMQIRKIIQTIEDLGSKSGFALISKKSFANNCLSCGRGDTTFLPTVPHIQGYDGRFYKADLGSFRPGATDSEIRHSDEDIPSSKTPLPLSKSPISMNKLPKVGVNSLLGKDLVNTLSTTSISPIRNFRPSSQGNT
ncbi:hypothetical protein SteCoe_1833 [Stentor coeruleus]|uniref:Uncharacterized protein n=1 Tax=Stentor coeruleus TaxID=5963 RepID=A0A1R2D121_9CILI|nr:hypothetical protein SteCoe_1833 [Stentor coeruleus]